MSNRNHYVLDSNCQRCPSPHQRDQEGLSITCSENKGTSDKEGEARCLFKCLFTRFLFLLKTQLSDQKFVLIDNKLNLVKIPWVQTVLPARLAWPPWTHNAMRTIQSDGPFQTSPRTVGEENTLNKYHMFSLAKSGWQPRFQYIWTRSSVCTSKCHSRSLTVYRGQCTVTELQNRVSWTECCSD